MPDESLHSLLKICWMIAVAYRKKCELRTLLYQLSNGVLFQSELQLGLVVSVTDRIRFQPLPAAVSIFCLLFYWVRAPRFT